MLDCPRCGIVNATDHQCQPTYVQALQAENERLRAENERLRANLDLLRPVVGILRRHWPGQGQDWSVRLTVVETDVIRRAIGQDEP